MKVIDYRLRTDDGQAIRFVRSPHVGGQIAPRFIVIHYTGGQSAEAAIAWMTDPKSKASAHLVVGRDGSVAQLVPFDRQAYHTGPSQWKGISGIARYSLGIELDNPGPLSEIGGRWKATFGKVYGNEQVLRASHKNGGSFTAWHTYTSVQIGVAVAVARAIIREYRIEEILGHDDISPGRKWDPGPAFPLEQFRERAFAQTEQQDS